MAAASVVLLVGLLCLATVVSPGTLLPSALANPDVTMGSVRRQLSESVTTTTLNAAASLSSSSSKKKEDSDDDGEDDEEENEREKEEGDTVVKRKKLNYCKDKKDECCDPNEDLDDDKDDDCLKRNVDRYKGDIHCWRDDDGDKKVDEKEKGRDIPWVCDLPTKFCNCSEKAWRVGPWKVGKVPKDYLDSKAGPKQTEKPYVAGTVAREDCCKHCSAINAAAGPKGKVCAYWLHFVPQKKGKIGNCTKECTDSNGCGYCIIYPTGLTPECDSSSPECRDKDDDDGEYAYKNTRYATVGKGCPGGKNDPHFVGAKGTMFDFNGVPNESFCLVTDPLFQVNMGMRGYYDSRTVGASILKNGKAVRTWIKDLGIMWVDPNTNAVHSLKLAARDGKEQDRGEGYMGSIEVDGAVLPRLSVGEEVAQEGGLVIRFVGFEKEGGGHYDVDFYEISIANRMRVDIRLRVAHPLLQTPDDAMTHINVRFMYVEHSPRTHGVLGQTFREGRERRAMDYTALASLMGSGLAADSDAGKGFLDGTAQDYKTSGVLASDCKFSAFNGQDADV